MYVSVLCCVVCIIEMPVFGLRVERFSSRGGIAADDKA